MLLNPDFCDLVGAIGRASLGASEKTIWHLTKVYWYTVEFGVVRERNAVKAFGAGILSRCAPHASRTCAQTVPGVSAVWQRSHACSYGELEWMGSGKATIEPFDPWRKLPKMSYKDGYQKRYFCLDSFHEGARLLQDFSRHIQAHNGHWMPEE